MKTLALLLTILPIHSLSAQTPRTQPIVIPRQVSEGTLPGPWQMNDPTQPQKHAGSLGGKSMFDTVYVFDKSVTGQLIKTEGFGSGKVGNYWNQNNTAGDTSLRAFLCGYAHDFTVDGRAEFRPYPFAYTPHWPPPDIHGPDMPQRADGVCMQGAGNRAARLRLFNIPGTALVMRPGTGTQAAFLGAWDMQGVTRVDDVSVAQAINGIDIRVGDAKLSNLWVDNVAKVGLTLDISGGKLDTDHICGADIACRVLSYFCGSNLYHESARIGTAIEENAHGCDIDKMDIGPGTCREFGIIVKSNGNDIKLRGGVGDPTKTHTQVIGLDCPGHGNDFKANFRVEKVDIGARLYGNAGTLDLETFQPNGGTAVEFGRAEVAAVAATETTPEKPKIPAIRPSGWRIYIRCQGYNKPVALDIKAMGTNNHVEIVTMGEPVKIMGSIPPGNEVWVDGNPY